MSIAYLQRQLESIYQVDLCHQVDDFLITDPELAALLDTSENARMPPEKLLVQQNGEDIDLSLYIEREVLHHLNEHHPNDALHDGNLEAFCIALEGVSHFLYLTWNALQKRSVTLLEMELQAEVDKFVSVLSLFDQQGENDRWRDLHRWLFDNASFASDLDEEQLTRYRDANRFAAKYCDSLDAKYLRHDNTDAMYEELRFFYRQPQGEKLRMINYPH